MTQPVQSDLSHDGWLYTFREHRQPECQELGADEPLPVQGIWAVQYSTNHATLRQLSWAECRSGPALYSDSLLQIMTVGLSSAVGQVFR